MSSSTELVGDRLLQSLLAEEIWGNSQIATAPITAADTTRRFLVAFLAMVVIFTNRI